MNPKAVNWLVATVSLMLHRHNPSSKQNKSLIEYYHLQIKGDYTITNLKFMIDNTDK